MRSFQDLSPEQQLFLMRHLRFGAAYPAMNELRRKRWFEELLSWNYVSAYKACENALLSYEITQEGWQELERARRKEG